MFGSVVANWGALDEMQQQRYRASYCGLCRAIHEDFSSLSRLSLNYDMTFLLLLLNSLYEPEEISQTGSCIAHPLKKHTDFVSAVTRYCAAMNVALAYYNCIDDWNDDRNVLKLAEAQLFRSARNKVAARYPRQVTAIINSLSALNTLEKHNMLDPDAAANSFGALMGELFVMDESDYWAPTLRTVGEGLGRFIYILDAIVDLEEDKKKKHYNPLSEMAAESKSIEEFKPFLEILIGESTIAFERLPLVQDADLMRNILYSGVWSNYQKALDKQNSNSKEGGAL